ncbi:MAG TPA: CBS domain-containing protein [Thermoanaerobaculia bacterium]|nr:CBS domain-containing protein [Thermoanaerobaculia bacterium]
MRIQDVMSEDVVIIAPATEIDAAKETLRVNEIGHLVVMQGKRVVGVLAEKDLALETDHKPVSSVMSRNVVTIEPSATLRHAAGIMLGRAVGCLPVIAHAQLVGIVTTSDLLEALAKGEIHAAPPAERFILRKRGPRKRPFSIQARSRQVCHPERERGTWAGGGARRGLRATLPPGPSLTLGMTNNQGSSAHSQCVIPSREDGEGSSTVPRRKILRFAQDDTGWRSPRGGRTPASHELR